MRLRAAGLRFNRQKNNDLGILLKVWHFKKACKLVILAKESKAGGGVPFAVVAEMSRKTPYHRDNSVIIPQYFCIRQMVTPRGNVQIQVSNSNSTKQEL
jgi:hypothetical protein